MKKTFLAKPIQYSEIFRKFAYGLFLSAVFMWGLTVFFILFAHAETMDETDETIVTSPSPEMLDRVRDAFSQFQAATPPEHFNGMKAKANSIVRNKLCGGVAGRPGGADSHPEGDGQGNQSNNGNCDPPVQYGQGGQTEAGATQPELGTEIPIGQSEQGGKVAASDAGSRVYYFFSFSMPDESLQRSVRDVYELRKQGTNVVMVIRGFVRNDMQSTVMAFEKLKRESGIESDLPVDIDPPLWEQYGITVVPVLISSSRKGIGKVTGDVGIPYALSRIDTKIDDYGKEGHTYEIAEEDLLKVIEAKKPLIEAQVRQRIETLQNEMYLLKKHDGQYEKATRDRVYYIDPSLVLTDDILDHEGKVLFPKGSVFNPADHVRLGRYIIIDGNDPRQVQLALDGDYRKLMLISGDLAKLAGTHKKQFWFVPDDILKRFQIRRVPTIFEQEGRNVRVTEKAI